MSDPNDQCSGPTALAGANGSAHFVVAKQPMRVPIKKGPIPEAKVSEYIVELRRLHPGAALIVVEVRSVDDIWVHGPDEWLWARSDALNIRIS